MKLYNVMIIGATGLVGKTLVQTLSKRNFPIKDLTLFATINSVGKNIMYKEKNISVLQLTKQNVIEKECDIAFLCADENVSKQYAPLLIKKGVIVIDNSSAFRLLSTVPLVVPEINANTIPNTIIDNINTIIENKNRIIENKNRIIENKNSIIEDENRISEDENSIIEDENRISEDENVEKYFKNINDLQKQGILISNPNCSTIISALPLAPLNKKFKLKKVVLSTYQAVSGAGSDGIYDLVSAPPLKKFPFSIKNNALAQIGEFNKNGFSTEEMKLINELPKILEINNLSVIATAVRVPIINCHSVSIYAEFEDAINQKEINALLNNCKGVKYYNPSSLDYPMPITSNGKDYVSVGRLRIHNENSLSIWVVGDNLLKGAALNAIQIAELFLK
ncbi:MAG: Asd/ArgC dimerization domain-containing protein [Clostridia bacterium]